VDTSSGDQLYHELIQSAIPTADMTKMQCVESQGWDSLESSPLYDILKEFEDVFPSEVPSELPIDPTRDRFGPWNQVLRYTPIASSTIAGENI
jgi:hypothetical protein